MHTATLSHQDYLPPSTYPPTGLNSQSVPQFIILGFDDNQNADSMDWVLDLLDKSQNPDGTGDVGTFDGLPIRATFFSNGMYWGDSLTVAAHQRAVAAGHELANHSQNHPHGMTFTVDQWKNEIMLGLKTFHNAGIDLVTGFRTPFLEYSGDTFRALSDLGIVYDSSIQEGVQQSHDGTNFFWPYTLDEGSPGNAAIYTKDKIGYIDSCPGLWEIPVHVFMVPDDNDCVTYGVPIGLRNRVSKKEKRTNLGKITGFDWNVFESAGCTGTEYLAILKYTLDLRLAGNRAPFMIGGHTSLYPTDRPERRKAIDDFIKYAVSIPEVRFVTVTQLIGWLRIPSSLQYFKKLQLHSS